MWTMWMRKMIELELESVNTNDICKDKKWQIISWLSWICQENRGTTPDECAYNEVSNHSEKILTKWVADIN